MTRIIDDRTFIMMKTIPVRNQECNHNFGLSRQDAHDQANAEARSLHKAGRRARVIKNANGYGIWVEAI